MPSIAAWIGFFTSKLVNAVVSFQSFSQFTLANRNLRSSSAYSNCQKRLLKQKIIIKKNKFKQYPLELNSVKKQVQGKMCFSNFWNNCAFFLNNNNKNLAELKIPETKNVKNSIWKFYTDFKNLFSLIDDEKMNLCKGVNFLILSKHLDYADHMSHLGLLFRDINKNEMHNEEKEFIKTRLKYFAFTSFWPHSYNIQINLTKTKRLVLDNLSNNRNIIIQKSARGTFAFLDKEKCLERISITLDNNAKFLVIIQFDHHKELNYVLILE